MSLKGGPAMLGIDHQHGRHVSWAGGPINGGNTFSVDVPLATSVNISLVPLLATPEPATILLAPCWACLHSLAADAAIGSTPLKERPGDLVLCLGVALRWRITW